MDPYETTIYHAVLITSLVLGTVIIYFAVSVIRIQRRHFERKRSLLISEIALLESERTRIANDLHDELGPLLSVTRIQISKAADQLATPAYYLEKAEANILTVIERLGGIARNLTPKLLVTKGLEAALQDFIDQYRHISSIRFRLCYEVNQHLSGDQSLLIYRLVQETVHNAVKHSGAHQIQLHLKEYDKQLYISCKDDGNGFASLPASENGMGLTSLHNRAEIAGGHLQCTTAAGSGTEYFFQIPLNI
ncbi:MAG: hypothetical protein JWP69_1704 [Flaviaesturariibacter sp.]|nr:hypothetical protein [Flaviaesturariibacter sp.]